MSGTAAETVWPGQEVVQWPGQEIKASQGEHGYAPAPPEAPPPVAGAFHGTRWATNSATFTRPRQRHPWPIFTKLAEPHPPAGDRRRDGRGLACDAVVLTPESETSSRPILRGIYGEPALPSPRSIPCAVMAR